MKYAILAISIIIIWRGAPGIILWWLMDYQGPVPKWYPYKINPWLFGLAIGRKPHKKEDVNDE